MRNPTYKQRQFIGRVAKGETPTHAVKAIYNVTTDDSAHNIASQNMRKPVIREALEPYLDKHNLTVDRALKPISDALDATETKFNEVTGKTIKTVNHAVRLQASDRVLKLRGIGQQNQVAAQTFIQINQAHLNKYLTD